MILVIPVSDADIDQAEKLFSRIASLATPNYPVPSPLVVSMAWGTWFERHRLESILPDADYFQIPTQEEIGWPESSNHMFYNTAVYVANKYPNHAWYFMEADTYPLIASWWETMKEEYEDAGKPYMGVVSDTVRGSVKTGEYWVAGKHMTGTAVYPADFLQRCSEIQYLMREPWDIEIGPKILSEVHDTKLIAHRWSSSGYYYKDGVIHITKSKATSKFSAAHVQPIQPEAVVVHGCKDGSIYALDQPLGVS